MTLLLYNLQAMLCFGMLVAFLLDFGLAKVLDDDLAWRFMVSGLCLR